MRAALLALALAAAGGCAGQTVLEAGGGQTFESPRWQGEGPTIVLRVRRESEQTWCELEHISNLRSGPPFNRDPETTINQLTCGIRWVLK